MVARISTGEKVDARQDPAKESHRKGGLKRGKTRVSALSSEKRREIASRAAAARRKKG